ncbi:kinase-like domain-containing protein [Globomyces pollinis-pini]|nr:kinase-like domain-containing protein [Globomyces pollinis-pini]
MAQPQLAACEYKTGKTLGQGSYAVVKEAVKIKTGERFACKMISKKLMKGKEHMILNEIEVLKKISQGHKSIVTLHDYFETPNNLYLVLDLCTGGELFDRICETGHFYEKDAADIIKTVLDAVSYLHKLNIVHRDLKPENLLFRSRDPDSDLMIADFGLSKIIDDGDGFLKTTCGTPGYMAPEILEKSGHGKPVDIWAIGVMAFFLNRLSGYMPFESESQAKEYDNILNAKFTFDPVYWDEISKEAKSFISSTLRVNPSKRLTVDEALNHPWLVDANFGSCKDLLPAVKSGFNARKMFRKAIDVVKAVNKLSASNLLPSNSNLTSSAKNSGVDISHSGGNTEGHLQVSTSGNGYLSVNGPASPLPLTRDASFEDIYVRPEVASKQER